MSNCLDKILQPGRTSSQCDGSTGREKVGREQLREAPGPARAFGRVSESATARHYLADFSETIAGRKPIP